jgi:FAD:protein FMN transferase
MPLVETLPAGPDCAQWSVWGTVARIVVTEPREIDTARAAVEAELAAIDAACSRFRADSELRSIEAAAGRPVRVSPRLTELIATALTAADQTAGDVDPTVGGALWALGYDRDFAEVAMAARELATGPGPLAVYPAADWRSVRLAGDILVVPAGVRLDLGATAKAWAADRCAALAHDACGGAGVLVSLGGDIATAGPAPEGGWSVLVRDGADEPAAEIALPARAALATSSMISRSWRNGARTLHHIIDPRHGRPASQAWRTVSVAAYTCVRANTLSTAALVRGPAAPRWLRELGAPARLVAVDRTVHTLGAWPARAEVRP